jgi:saccharopine dehydrogenase-like NADP-dependent oxidoreductase
MSVILILGAGKSSSSLIQFLLSHAAADGFHVWVADGNLEAASSKINHHPFGKAIALDVLDAFARKALLQQADILISLLPPALHAVIAQDALALGKHLLTASYVDEPMRQLAGAIQEKHLLFLCEMGLDPGIDHMSAMAILDDIKKQGGTVKEFISHCGGLVAPESDNNPWHYKISWNPKNVVLAGKAGAHYREKKQTLHRMYQTIFEDAGQVSIPSIGTLAYYPNRDSLSYMPLYQLTDCDTFIRTTLRHPAFMEGWSRVVALGLTDESQFVETAGMSIADFFKPFSSQIQQYSLDIQQQFSFLGWQDHQTLINRGRCSYAEVLQFCMEQKWVLAPEDKDMIVMLHQIGYEMQGDHYWMESSLVVRGEDAIYTAMAKTVGLPLGIAARLLHQGKLEVRGLHIPIIEAIYRPVLAELADAGIQFQDQVRKTDT